jgi:carboxypeptidase PM20D1
MKRTLLLLLLIVLLVAGVIGLRAIQFHSKQLAATHGYDFKLDERSFTKRLSKAVQYRTISQEPSNGSFDEFLKFHKFLQESFPATHKTLTKEVVGDFSLLFTWKGQNEQLKPILLMGHMDVVPVDPPTENKWTYPPFSGEIADGYIWGRGTMDDKVSVIGILEAVEQLLALGFQPQRTVYLAFGHDEEIGGQNGAVKIAALLDSRKVDLEYVLDEGGNITNGIIPSVSQPVALVGIAEKGYLSLELTVESSGGHSSIPPSDAAIGILSSAIHKLQTTPFPTRLTEPTRKLLEFIGPELPWIQRMALSNLWLFEPWVRKHLEKSPVGAAMIKTTQAPTIFEAGIKENVLPTKARSVVNFRLLPGDTIAAVTSRVRKIIGDPQIEVTPLSVRMEPSPISDIESEAFGKLHSAIRQTEPTPLVAPALLVAATDSRHYSKLTKNIFRFLPISLGLEDTRRYHGTDERISIKDYERCVRFYATLMADAN